MKHFPIQRRPDGSCHLHTWRVGGIYYGQNRQLTLKDWTNLVHRNYCHHRNPDGIPVWDSRRGLPYPDAIFDAIYSCHVIEHMTPKHARGYVTRLMALLKPGGVCRISTPDLELQARTYVACLDACLANPDDVGQDNRRVLATSTLIDQLCRQESGGELLRYFREEEVDHDLSQALYGAVYREFLPADAQEADYGAKSPRQRRASWSAFVDRIKLKMLRWLRHDPLVIGERELWVWDQCSLTKLLEQVGFTDVKLRQHDTSEIADWDRYQFDTYRQDGKTPLEQSLIMEARRRLERKL